MEIDSLEKKLMLWKQILFIVLGASITLLATGVGELPMGNPFFPGWYAVWFVIQLAAILPGFVLLLGKHWVKLPLKERLNTIFGYFAVAWIVFLAFGVRSLVLPLPGSYWWIAGLALVMIAGSYGWLYRKLFHTPEEIFP